MAEQEACTALVDQATKGEEPATPTTPTAGQIEGESQLLPLLKGLLDAPESDITPDSGTESGEDQRSNLINEVQAALEKLSVSLKSDQTDISAERRSSLLQLVSKLQAGLNGSDRRASTSGSSSGRFQKRKNKQTRHTVGVSKEELADARRLIEQISLNDLGPSASSSKVTLSKQNSESSVPTSSASSSYRSIHQAKVKNATARPFSSSNSTTSSVQTPTEHFEGFFAEEKDKDSSVIPQKTPENHSTIVQQSPQAKMERTISEDSNVSIKSACKAAQQAAASKIAALKQEEKEEESGSEYEEVEEEVEEEEEEEEVDSSTVKSATPLENAPLKSNPIYSEPSQRPVENTYIKPSQKHEEKCSRFDTQKKIKMKRANTIDIPKPLNFYEDDDTDSENEDENNKRRDSCYALRGPVGVGNPHTKKIVPTFQPKTESDKKFIAFINKHNDNNSNKGSPWAKNSSVWGSKFGNIKNTFEKSSSNDAKSFWKSADDNITMSTPNQFGPKISRQSARNLQQMFEEKKKESQAAPPSWKKPNQSHVITGSLQVKTEPEKQYKVVPQPLPVNQFSHAPQSAFKPIKRAPQTSSNRTSLVFSPDNNELIKSEIKDQSGSVFLYSPKPLSSSVESSTVTSPVGSKPWAATTGGSRVLSLAASRFEQPAPVKEPPRPRRSSRESNKNAVINYQANANVIDRKPSYLNKAVENRSSTVRKLSDQYQDIDNKAAESHQRPQTYQIKTSVVESQYTPQVKPPSHSVPLSPPQNYSIRYDQPVNYSIRYDQPQNQTYSQQTTPPINYSIRYDQPQTQSYPQQNRPVNYTIRYDQPQTQTSTVHNYNRYSQGQTQPSPNQNYQPQNYSIVYDKPQPVIQSPKTPPYVPQNTPFQYEQPRQAQQNEVYRQAPIQTARPIRQSSIDSPKKQDDFTSTFVFKPAQKVPVQAIEPVVQPPRAERQISNESLHEHSAVSSRVMTGPVSQQAVTVKQKSPMSRDQHDMEAAFNLRNSLQKVSKQDSKENSISPNKSPARSPSNSFSYKPRQPEISRSPGLSQSFKYKSETQSRDVSSFRPSDCPKPTISPSSFKFKSSFEDTLKEAKSCGVVKPMQQQKPKPTPIFNNVSKSNEKLHINEKGQSVLTGQFHIPVINVKSPESPRAPTQAQVLSKSDSWHQICMGHQTTSEKPAPKPGPVKSKSSNTLAVPKLFEAGMSKEEMLHKRKTMEAFLSGNKSPPADGGAKTVRRSINRIRTSEKVSTQTKVSGSLSRSRTLPDITCPQLLDENNVDKAFEELFESS